MAFEEYIQLRLKEIIEGTYLESWIKNKYKTILVMIEELIEIGSVSEDYLQDFSKEKNVKDLIEKIDNNRDEFFDWLKNIIIKQEKIEEVEYKSIRRIMKRNTESKTINPLLKKISQKEMNELIDIFIDSAWYLLTEYDQISISYSMFSIFKKTVI